MFTVNLRLTLIVLLLVPTTVILVQLFGRRLHRLSRQMYDELGQVSDHIQELAGAIRVVKVFNSQPSEQARFDALLARFLARGVAARLAVVGAGIRGAAPALGLPHHGRGLRLRALGQGQTTYGQLVTFLLLAFRVATPLGTLTSLYASFQGATAAADRLDDVFREAPEGPRRTVGYRRRPRRPGAITLEHVDFRYPGRRGRARRSSTISRCTSPRARRSRSSARAAPARPPSPAW